jgi:hypothetical protein
MKSRTYYLITTWVLLFAAVLALIAGVLVRSVAYQQAGVLLLLISAVIALIIVAGD